MRKKSKLLLFLVIVFVVLLIPIRVYYKDGGSVGYKALLYEVLILHRLSSENNVNGYLCGKSIRILSRVIYEEFWFEKL